MRVMYKYFLFLASFIVSTLLLSSCSTGPKVVKLSPSPTPPTFKVVSSNLKGNLNIRMAIIKPGGEVKALSFANAGKISMLPIQYQIQTVKNGKIEFPDLFQENLLKSIESIAMKKGYNVVGAFDSWEVMTYGDKKRVEIALIPRISLFEIGSPSCNSPGKILNALGMPLGEGKIVCADDVRYKCELVLEMIEPLTREKLFIKSFEFLTKPQHVDVEVKYSSDEEKFEAQNLAINKLKEAEQGALNRALEEAYNKYIELVEKYLPEGEEAKSLAKQALQLKKEKRY